MQALRSHSKRVCTQHQSDVGDGCDCRQCEAGSADGSAASGRTSSGVLPLTRETPYRVGSVGQDCQLLLWDFIISDDYTGACIDQR